MWIYANDTINESVGDTLNKRIEISNDFLYHSTNIKFLDDIKEYGLIPDFGDTIRQAYGGYYDFDGDSDQDEEEAQLN